MIEERRVTGEGSMATTATPTTTVAAETRQRKKRKWDQPAESLISAGLATSGVLSLGSVGNLVGVSLPAVASLPGGLLANSVPAIGSPVAQIFQAPTVQQNAAAIVQKLNLPKIQDEVIAREIVINDAESTIRYKLTKRQTQEEIQKCTGAVVITRGKYRPPNGVPDSEKPLYLHISAGVHLKDTGERIKAVDRAAAMVEEILKQGQNSKPMSSPIVSVMNAGLQVNQPLSTCVFLGFETDPSLNIAARIRGPNDQYINHIMNETGATVILRGHGSGNIETPNGEELQQPLHLYLSSNNPKSLEDAKLLAENLLDTISVECCASRVSSSKVYGAVPPPQQLLAGVQSASMEPKVNTVSLDSSTCSPIGSTSVGPFLAAAIMPLSSVTPPQGTVAQTGALFNYRPPQSNMICYPQPPVTGGTSYSGYGGIYPQATPLQQVALALRQAPAQTTAVLSSTTSTHGTSAKTTASSSTMGTEKRLQQKRKFQELPVSSQGPVKPNQNSRQGSEFLKPGDPYVDLGVRNVSTMPPPKKLVQSASNGMLPPSPRNMPPPPPKFPSPPVLPSQNADDKNSIAKKPTAEPVPGSVPTMRNSVAIEFSLSKENWDGPLLQPRSLSPPPPTHLYADPDCSGISFYTGPIDEMCLNLDDTPNFLPELEDP